MARVWAEKEDHLNFISLGIPSAPAPKISVALSYFIFSFTYSFIYSFTVSIDTCWVLTYTEQDKSVVAFMEPNRVMEGSNKNEHSSKRKMRHE